MSRLKDRSVLTLTFMYATFALAALGALADVAAAFDWPPVLLRALIIALALGVPTVAVLAWFHGEPGRQRFTAKEVSILSGLFLVAALVFAWWSPSPAVSEASWSENAVQLADFATSDGGDPLEAEAVRALMDEELRQRLPGLGLWSGPGDVRPATGEPPPRWELSGTLNGRELVLALADRAGEESTWTESWDVRSASLAYTMYARTARAIAERLVLDPSASPSAGTVSVTPAREDAWGPYLDGVTALHQRSLRTVGRAEESFHEAIRRDPTFAEAFARLSATYLFRARFIGVEDATGLVLSARAAADSAIQLAPDMPDGYRARSDVHRAEFRWGPAFEDAEQALALAPGTKPPLRTLTTLYEAVGDTAAALESARSAVAADPSDWDARHSLAWRLYNAGHVDESIARYREVVDNQPLFSVAVGNLASVHMDQGQLEEALPRLRQWMELSGIDPSFGDTLVLAAERFRDSGEPQSIDRVYEATRANAVLRAHAAMWVGDHSGALGWLERGYETRAMDMFSIRSRPVWRPLYNEPRYQELLRRMGLTDPR